MKYILAIIVFIAQEVVAIILFPILNYYLGPDEKKAWVPKSIFKGSFERLLIYTALIHGYPHILTAFGAMKLGTRLHKDQESDISNTYFLVGNFLSVLLAIIGSVVTRINWEG